MPLTPGARLGPYQVVAKLGEGGMGEVYRARDTTLDRDVALKILPESFASDPDRLMRFEREAKTLASLNHPNIAAIYGIEDQALVMELVEGRTLDEIIAGSGRSAPGSGGSGREPARSRGLPVDEVVPIAVQVASALEAAHDSGIIHRDLKPANIKVREDGTVKVLDFGLAKALDAGSQSSQPRAESPTITSAALTQMGMILGTAAYMAPEQAKGKPVDKRADIWAFGVVLFEMLTGRRAFTGETVTDTIVSVVSTVPEWSALPSSTPASVRSLLRRCLDKDPRRRLRDIGEARVALEGGDDPRPADVRRGVQPLTWAVGAVAVVSLAVAAAALWNRPAWVEPATTRVSIALPPGAELTSYPAITRDGRTVAYVAQQGTADTQLYLRDLNAFETRTVPGSSGAKQPFFSPNGEWVAFFAQGRLLKAEVSGGTPIRLVEAAYPFGGTWNDDDTIVYAASLGSGLLQIPAGGGSPTSLTKPDGAALGYAHVFPQALPGGRRILFTTWGQANGAAVLSLESREWEVVLPQPGSAVATFASTGGSTGHVLLVDLAAGIRAAPFDAAHPGPTSAEALVLSDVYYEVEVESLGWLAVSNTGTAVYAAGDPARMTLVWVNRDGTSEPLAGGQGGQDVYREAQLSPDGGRAVIRRGNDMWTYDLERGTTSRLTTGTSNLLPVWSHDGTRVLFSSNQGGDWDIHAQPPDGSTPAAALFRRPYDQFPLSTPADGTLVFLDIQPTTGRDLWILSPGGEASPLRVTPFNETQAQVSPGPAGGPRRVAYASDESGRFEIYVESYPAGGNRSTVSTGGGILPRWSGDGRELFYVAEDAVMAVAVRPDASFGPPRRLFDRSPFLFNHRFNSYSVAPDGQRFLMIRRDPGSVPRQLNVILNWSAAGRLSPPS